MNSQILLSRADVEPLLLIQNDTADALTVRIASAKTGIKEILRPAVSFGSFLIPNRNVREIDAAGRPEPRRPRYLQPIGRQVEREIG